MSETNSHTDHKKSQVDRSDELADRRPQENAGREVRVLKAVGAYFATKRKRR